MSTPINTPGDDRDPMPAAPFTTADTTAAATYVETDLRRTARTLMITRVISILLLLSVLIETVYVTSNVQKYLQPQAAADVADGIIAQQVDNNSDQIKSAIVEKLPTLISSIPDQAIAQMPHFRESFEDQFQKDLTNYSQTASAQLDTAVDTYIAGHKDEVKQALTSGKDSAAVHEIGNGITQNFLDTLKTTKDGDETLQDKMDASLTDITEVKTKMDHLANGTKLTPDEKRTRHLIAVMTQSISKETPSIDVKSAISGVQTSVNDAVSGSQNDVNDGVSGSQNDVDNDVSGAQTNVKGAVPGTQTKVKGATSGAQTKVTGAVSGA